LVTNSAYYKKIGYQNTKCPEAERACLEVLSIPIHPLLSEDELSNVAESVKNCAMELR